MTLGAEKILELLEDTALGIKKAQINLKKCPKQRLTQGYIESRINSIEEYWRTYQKAHNDLVMCTTREERMKISYFANEDYYVCEEIYMCMLADLKDALLHYSKQSTSASSEKNDCSEKTDPIQVKLPRIQVPTFSGNYEDWKAFEDMFSSLVHENKTLSQVQKLHYLKCSLNGEAEALLKHLKVTDLNYVIAWEMLKSRYGNKRIIVNSLLKRLFNQRKVLTPVHTQIKTLLDTTNEILNSLESLAIPTTSWDPLIIYIVVQRLDSETHKDWEEHSYAEDTEELPTWSKLKRFLQSKYRTLELVAPAMSTNRDRPVKERSVTSSYAATTSPPERTCPLCKGNHTLGHCKEFSSMNTTDRNVYAKSNNLCFNCLAPGHQVIKCRLPLSCRKCNKRHHSLLHQTKVSDTVAQLCDYQPPSSSAQATVEEEEVQSNITIATHFTTNQEVALLATAIVPVRSKNGHMITLRALIDQGSQAAFISEKATQLLKLKRHRANGTVIGVGSTKTSIKHVVQLEIQSRLESTFNLPVQAYVMSKQLTTKIPTQSISGNWQHLEGLNLADPSYLTPSSIDLLLGVKEYAQIIQPEIIKGQPGSPCAQRTSLGWIIFGEISASTTKEVIVMHHQVDVDEMLKTIWEIEPETKRSFTREEKLCEEIYEQTHTRNEEGAYVVKLPFSTDNPRSLNGNSKEIAKHRLLQLERKFKRNPKLQNEYKNVIEEHLSFGYMEEIPENEINNKSVYLPHHAVIREEKESSKLRIVFDASCRSGKDNVSLNDDLLVGPQLQDDLRSLIMRWRVKPICYVADIKKMFLQVLVTGSDADTYQRLLWRFDPAENIKHYRLLRVTFGTASAPYLAVKTLQQLADDEGSNLKQKEKIIEKSTKNKTVYLPEHASAAVQAIKEDFYMDDLMSGSYNVSDAIHTANHISEILQRGGFTLSKWASNNAEFMKSIAPEKRSSLAQLDMNIDGTIKALGVAWNLKSDRFEYSLVLPPITTTITKRTILSDIQKLFDPLGWIAPAIINAKILIQRLWLLKVSWDEEIEPSLQEKWIELRNDLSNVKFISINRWLRTRNDEDQVIEIHGFSDASMKAYAAVAYMRIVAPDKTVHTELIAARTRVAPVRTVSLPRLELCGALLLSKLLKQIIQAMRLSSTPIYAWTDSSIVLAWINGDTNRWKPFVANRVVEITDTINKDRWFHVDTKNNPADVASRGILLSELKNSDIWWRGPIWLSETEIQLAKPEITPTDMEIRNTIQTNLNVTEDKEKDLESQFADFDTLKQLMKTIAYCRRLLYSNIDEKIKTGPSALTIEELNNSLKTCTKIVQRKEFGFEIETLKNGKGVNNRSSLISLNPYLDKDNILRVGGRLRHANLNEDHKHPMIISKTNNLACLIIDDAHKQTLHGGVQLMISYIRSKFWIIRSKNLVKLHVRKCLICAKQRATPIQQIMGDLPIERVTPTRPFLRSGVDFAGPFQVLNSKGRGVKTNKAYICIFVCMATKCVHLELVGDMSSESFIGAFKRFVSRRGKCSHLWSDQGRNFVGANKELLNAWKAANLQFTDMAESLATDGTQWHFIPAYSPNFGGIWEAGVKSVKYHLKRILVKNMTFEELSTLLCQIEACLNSRPLNVIDDDVENLNPLTPGHFLIGDLPIAVPEPMIPENVNVNHLARWQHMQKLFNDFWRRWQQDYLLSLQQRHKWRKRKNEFAIGDIVLIKTEGLPPGKWSLGRIEDTHPGADNVTRVYSVKSGNSVVRRSVSKLCPLPIEIE